MSSDQAAFFDVDGTLIKLTSLFSFLQYFWQHPSIYGPEAGAMRYHQYQEKINAMYADGVAREDINIDYYAQFKGVTVSQMDQIGEQWWSEVNNTKSVLNHPLVERLIAHQNNGVNMVFVTGSMGACVAPIKKMLGVAYSLHTTLTSVNGVLTGNIQGATMIGDGKAKVVKKFAKEAGVVLEKSYAYGDHISDAAMLALVGTAVAVNPNEAFDTFASSKGWECINC